MITNLSASNRYLIEKEANEFYWRLTGHPFTPDREVRANWSIVYRCILWGFVIWRESLWEVEGSLPTQRRESGHPLVRLDSSEDFSAIREPWAVMFAEAVRMVRTHQVLGE